MITKILAALSSVIIAVIAGGAYAGILLLMAIESACIPLPSEIIMPFSGALTIPAIAALYHHSALQLLWVATFGALGCNLGSAVAYAVGYFGGPPLVRCFGRLLWISEHELELTHNFFERHGGITVFFARLLPVVRTFIALPAGVARMPQLRFHVYTFLGSWPWCLGLAYLGMKLGENWRALGQYFHKFDAVIGIIIVAGIVWFIWSHWQNRMGRQSSKVAAE